MSDKSLDNTIGALQIGCLFSVFLFGIVTMQVYQYFKEFKDDRWAFKALITVVWLLELGHTTGVSYAVYHATVTLYGQPDKIIRFPALGVITAVGGAITFLVEGFFCIRAYKILPKTYGHIGLLGILVGIPRLFGSVYLSVQAVAAPNIALYRVQWSWLITTLLVSSAAIDIAIAVTMLYYLLMRRSQALRRFTRLMDRMVVLTIRTGLLTSITAVVVVITFQIQPHNLIWLAIYTFLGKLYSNTLLSALNDRKVLREELFDLTSVEVYSQNRSTSGEVTDQNRTEVISIQMETITEVVEHADTSKRLFTNGVI